VSRWLEYVFEVWAGQWAPAKASSIARTIPASATRFTRISTILAR
jgi:hypothetical protein